MSARRRLDSELVRRGLARSREQAVELVGAGRVKVGGQTATKAATQVETSAPIVIQTVAKHSTSTWSGSPAAVCCAHQRVTSSSTA